MIPEQSLMMALALAVEEKGEEVGWDQEALLAYVFRNLDPEHRMAYMAIMPFPMQPQEIADDVAEGLMYMGGKIRYDMDGPEILPPGMKGEFAGLLFMAEGYAHHPDDPAERAEVRFVDVIDCAGRLYTVTRRRGGKPDQVVLEPGGEVRAYGKVGVGMRDLMVAISRELPAGTMDVDAVASIAAEGLEK